MDPDQLASKSSDLDLHCFSIEFIHVSNSIPFSKEFIHGFSTIGP